MSRLVRRAISSNSILRSTHPITRLENSASGESPDASTSSPESKSDAPLNIADVNLPVPVYNPTESRHLFKPPFNTYRFIRQLSEQGDFPEGMSKGIMLIARELIRSREMAARDSTIDKGDLENEAYLFKAALSELRSEAQSRGRADAAAIRTTLGALRREVDNLAQKLKEDADTLKHEIQMEMNNRKNDSRVEMKVADVAVEEMSHKSTITIGELRTEIEQAKWNNTRRGVGVIAFFVVFIIASVELLPSRPTPTPSASAPAPVTNSGNQQAILDLREFEKDEQ